MAGSVRSHAKTYIPVGRRQDNPCLPCLAPPLHSTISMAKCGVGESVCIDFFHELARGVKLGGGIASVSLIWLRLLASRPDPSIETDWSRWPSWRGRQYQHSSPIEAYPGISVWSSHRRQHAKLSPHDPWPSVFALQC